MDKRIIVALDFPTLGEASRMSALLGDRFGYKVGMQLNAAAGTPVVLDAVGAGKTFLDLKFKDIPNTVAGAVEAVAQQGVWMMNLYIDGGEKMMEAAVKARDKVFLRTGHRSLLLGVTMLTSLDENALVELGIYREKMTLKEIVVQLAKIADQAGLDGAVCSPQEIEAVRRAVPHDHFKIVAPGIRGKDALADDQKRTMPAREAIELGATHLVIGRPITASPDPAGALENFLREIS